MPQPGMAVVVTSIAAPNGVLRSLAGGCRERGIPFYVVGDEPSPADFQLDGCRFFGVGAQLDTGFRTATACPRRHYARKNVGYLLAMRDGAATIVETDDDNYPRAEFWAPRERRQTVPLVEGAGWVNVYAYFSDTGIWPRGLPLDAIRQSVPVFDGLQQATVDCPIQQGLADEEPDVDAIYRLVVGAPVNFRRDRRVALGAGSWCPFNSQNTTWWPEAWPLLYLPAWCSFRMTDIWRGLVAQRIAWANGWPVLFHEATVWQERNSHNLVRDFEDEIAGYLQNRRIAEALERAAIAPGAENVPRNLLVCYEALVGLGVIDRREMPLVEAWLDDIAAIRPLRRAAAAGS